jgi:hypothetical protein
MSIVKFINKHIYVLISSKSSEVLFTLDGKKN